MQFCKVYYNLNDCFISHAGISACFKNDIINNGKFDEPALDKVVKNNLLSENSIVWTRGNLANLGNLQVVGHTRQKEVKYDEKSNTLYIDTSAYSENKLTAVIIDKNKMIDSISEFTDEKDLMD